MRVAKCSTSRAIPLRYASGSGARPSSRASMAACSEASGVRRSCEIEVRRVRRSVEVAWRVAAMESNAREATPISSARSNAALAPRSPASTARAAAPRAARSPVMEREYATASAIPNPTPSSRATNTRFRSWVDRNIVCAASATATAVIATELIATTDRRVPTEAKRLPRRMATRYRPTVASPANTNTPISTRRSRPDGCIVASATRRPSATAMTVQVRIRFTARTCSRRLEPSRRVEGSGDPPRSSSGCDGHGP